MQTSEAQTQNSEAAILGRVLTDGANGFSPEVAHHILNVSFTEEDKARMHELAAKNQEGILSADELRELDNYIKVGDIVAILKSKARIALKKQAQP
jgi:hypothetical protein